MGASVQNPKITSNIFYFLLDYVQVGFYLCMIPLKVRVHKNGTLEFKHYQIHQLICFVLHTASLAYGATALWSMITYPSSRYNGGSASSMLHEYALFAVLNVAVVCFFVNCWICRPNPHKHLLSQTFKYIDVNCSPRYRATSMSFMIGIVLIQILTTAFPEIKETLEHTKSILTGFNSLMEKSALDVAREFAVIFMSIYFQVLFQIAVIIPFDVACLCMYMIGCRFKDYASIEYAILALPSTNWEQRHQSLERLMDYFLSAKHLTKCLNKTFGINILIILLSSLPTIGYGLSVLISHSTAPLADHIRTIYILGSFYIFLMLAAKGHENVQSFAQTAFEKNWSSGALKVDINDAHQEKTKSLLLTITQYANSTCVGVGGTPFFITTYRFIATMTSGVITYTIIMFQFRE